MAKRKRDVAIEEKRKLAESVPVAQPFHAEPPAPPTPRYLQQPELREAWVDILAARVLRQPIPAHLALNDSLVWTNMRAAQRVLDAMARDRAEVTPENVRSYADRAIPKA